jgi:xylulokinase
MSAQVDKYVLAIDLGTSSAKVALISMRGDVAGWECEPIGLTLLPNGGAEQDPLDWWNGIMVASKRLLGRRLIPAEAVVAVCASTQGGGTAPVDRDGNCLMNCMIWLDSRAAQVVRRHVGGGLDLGGYNALKLQKWVNLTGGAPSLSGKDRYGHMLWIKAECPDLYARTFKFLDVLDYVDLKLTGQFVTSADSAVGTWMTDNRDPRNVHYVAELAKLGGLEIEKLPAIRRSIDVLGPLRSEVAEELGLRKEVVVVTGAFDVPAAALGAGTVRDFEPHVYLGTSSWVGVHVPFKKTDVASAMASLPCAIPDKFLLMAAQEVAGGNLTFFRDNILFSRDAMLDQEAPRDYFAALNRVAESVPPGSRGVLYTPWLYGERAPVDDPWVRASFHNLSLGTTRADMVRALMEGVALNTRWVFEPAEKFAGRRLDPVSMVGGGAQSNLWCQVHADVLNRTVRQVKDPVYGNARGAAFMAAVGLGLVRFEDISNLIKYQATYTPDPDRRALYDSMYREYLTIYKVTHKIHERLNRARN